MNTHVMNWPRIRLRHLSATPIRNGIGESAQDGLPEWPRYVRITDIAGPRKLRDDVLASLPPDLARQAPLNGGDILISAVGATYGKSYLHRGADQPHCYAGYLVKVTPSTRVLPEFAAYWTESSDYWAQVNSRVIQATIQNFSAARVKDLALTVPPLDVQSKVVAFLDRETAVADSLIAKYDRLIELLEEKKAALVARVITKGLDPNVPLTESGIASIGAVPASWKVHSLRRVIGRFVDYRGSTPTKVESGIRIVTAANVKMGYIDYTAVEAFISENEYRTRMVRGFPALGDVLLTMEAPLGQCAQVDDARISLGQRVMLLKADVSRIESAYLKWFFLSRAGQDELKSHATGSTALGIKASKLKAIKLPVPSLSEQLAITAYIEDELKHFRELSKKCADAISLVREHRAALITTAVTGGIDVRNYRSKRQPVEMPV